MENISTCWHLLYSKTGPLCIKPAYAGMHNIPQYILIQSFPAAILFVFVFHVKFVQKIGLEYFIKCGSE